MIGKLLVTTALAGVLLSASAAGAVSNSAPKTQPARPAPASSADGTFDRRALMSDAVAALRETQNAIVAIDQNKPKQAIGALERATGKLEVTLARTPTLALAPVDVSMVTYDVLGSVQDVDNARAATKDALDHGRLQEARFLISTLASETQVDVSNLPLATYPAAIKQAAALLNQGKLPEAKVVLQAALNTVVVQRTVIPLPLVRAQKLLDQAKSLAEKPSRTDAESAQLKSLLAGAREQLRLGQALGYGSVKGLNDLQHAVDEVEQKTSGKQASKGLFDQFGRLFGEAKANSQPVPKR